MPKAGQKRKRANSAPPSPEKRPRTSHQKSQPRRKVIDSDDSSDELVSEEDGEDESETDGEEVEEQYAKLQADRLAEGRKKKVCRLLPGPYRIP